MKVGDLVRWTHPDNLDVGIVIELDGDQASIVWQREPEYSGEYPIDNEHMELLSEDR